MIYLSIKGRLGNQMFQYAFARALKEKLKQDTIIDWHYVNESDRKQPGVGFHNSLSVFNVADFKSLNVNGSYDYMNLKQKIAFRYYEKNFPYRGSLSDRYLFEEKFLKKNMNSGLLFFQNGYYNFELNKLPKNVFLNGYYESEKYFSDIENIIKNEFTPIHNKLEHNNDLYRQIENSNSVCVTVRRGDFLKSSLHNVCTIEYFLKGMDIIASKISDAKFFIFSNDVEWLKENVDFKYPVVFENGSDPVWEKLRLMYSCKHFVISNSTFSWWAQYLSSNKDKIVIAPDRWYNSEIKSDLLENGNYIKIKCN